MSNVNAINHSFLHEFSGSEKHLLGRLGKNARLREIILSPDARIQIALSHNDVNVSHLIIRILQHQFVLWGQKIFISFRVLELKIWFKKMKTTKFQSVFKLLCKSQYCFSLWSSFTSVSSPPPPPAHRHHPRHRHHCHHHLPPYFCLRHFMKNQINIPLNKMLSAYAQ